MIETIDLEEEFSRHRIDIVVDKIRRLQVHALNRKRNCTGEYHHLFPQIKQFPDKFKQYLRMEVKTFEYILSAIRPCLVKKWSNFHRQPIMPEERLVLTLRFLATGMSYSDLGFSFRMGISTVCTVVKETMEMIWACSYQVHMPVPTEEDLIRISDDFYRKRGFPHCLGAVDCKHIRIKKPAHSKSEYYNYKKFYSVKLQAVVDSDHKFMCIDVGAVGSEHDAKTLKNSSFSKALTNKIIQIPEPDALPGSNDILPYFFIGDGAYPLMENLMKPFRGKDLFPSEKKFNKNLSNTRVDVECAFGIMCRKWKIYYTTMQLDPATVKIIAKCTCLLQNIIIDVEKINFVRNNANANFYTQSGGDAFEEVGDVDDSTVGGAELVRAALMRYIWHHMP